MGHELYRMIRDGAPPDWTTEMRLVAMVIADDALDASQGPPGGGGWPRSAIRIHGGHTRGGEWFDGIAERTGMSERAISRALTALARAGYEIREQIDTDRRGRPVFAYPGRSPRFRVPPLTPRECPPNTATIARRIRRPQEPAGDGDHSPPDLASKVAENGELLTPKSLTHKSSSSRRTPRTGSRRRAAATDKDDFDSLLDKIGAAEPAERELIRRLADQTGDPTGYVRQYVESSDGGESFMRYVRRVVAEAEP